MNKRDLENTRDVSIDCNDNSSINIYIVLCTDNHYMPSSSTTKKNTYTLMAFDNKNSAKEFMEAAYESIVTPLVKSGKFKVILYKTTNESEVSGFPHVIAETTVKLVGNKECNKAQTRLLKFTIEKTKLKMIGHLNNEV